MLYLCGWVGGKTRLLDKLDKLFPMQIEGYCEPFLGGGSVYLNLAYVRKPKKVVLSDFNEELVNVYNQLSNKEATKEVVDIFTEHAKKFVSHKTKEDAYVYFKQMIVDLNLVRYDGTPLSAALWYFLVTFCFNAKLMYTKERIWSNICTFPMGSHFSLKNRINRLYKLNEKLDGTKVYCDDYQSVIDGFMGTCLYNNLDPSKSLVYLDPPYDKEKEDWVVYSGTKFVRDNQVNLFNKCVALNNAGFKFVQSNAKTAFIMDLYKDFDIIEVETLRSMAGNVSSRGKCKEVFIKNY